MALKPGQKPTTGSSKTGTSNSTRKRREKGKTLEPVMRLFEITTPTGVQKVLLPAQRVMILGKTGKIRWDWRPLEK